MKKNILTISILMLAGSLLHSCESKRDLQVPYPNDITFEEQTLDRFSYKIPDAPFKAGDGASGVVTVNVKNNGDGTFSGFAISNKNWRSYPWNLSPDFAPASLTPEQIQSSIDSTIFSVYTTRPNHTLNYLVGYAKDDDASISLDNPSVIEHILVANNTYNFLLESYGSQYSGTLDPVTQQYSLTGTKIRNVQNPNTATSAYGRFTLPGPGGSNLIGLAGAENLAKAAAGKTAADAARLAGKTTDEVAEDSIAAADALSKGYVKLTINGFSGATPTGSVDFFMAVRPGVDPAHPTWNFVQADWIPVDLTTLGVVDKIVFHLSSTYTDVNGNMLYPPYFCLDGIRLKK